LTRHLGNVARLRVHAVGVLELAREFFRQKLSGVADELLESITCFVVEGHASIPGGGWSMIGTKKGRMDAPVATHPCAPVPYIIR